MIRNKPIIRFNEYTSAWEQRKLGEVLADMYNGQTPYRLNEDNWNGNINWLSSGELNRGVVTKTVEKITSQGQKDANLKLIPKGTFVIAITGLEASGTRGNCAILGLDTTMNQSCMALFPVKELLDSRFLFQWYRKVSEEYGISYTQGTKQQSYNAEIIKLLPINLPSLKEQNKIAQFLFDFDNLITLHQRKLDTTNSLKKTMLSKMFPKSGQDKPEFRFNEYTDAWEQRKLGDIGDTFTGLSGKTKEDFGKGEAEFITYLNVFNNPISNIKLTERVELDKKQNEVRYGDIFFTTSSETPGEVGMSSVWLDNRENVYLNSFCFGYRLKDKVDPFYMAYSLRSNPIRNQFILLAQGISRYNISKTKAMDIEIMLPKLDEQIKLGKFFKQLDNLITLHQRELEKLKLMKQYLLKNMFV